MKKYLWVTSIAVTVASCLVACEDSAGADSESVLKSSASTDISSDANTDANSNGSGEKSENGDASSSSTVSSDSKKSSSSGYSRTGDVSPCKAGKEDRCLYSTVTDSRDSKIYTTVKIGDQWWMAENLNYADSTKTESLKGRSFCYLNKTENCDKFGRLYTWAAAIDSVALYNGGDGVDCGNKKTCEFPAKVRGICPENWHLPSSADWTILIKNTGHVFKMGDPENTSGENLKSQTGWSDWENAGNGTDAYGFSVLPAGYALASTESGAGVSFTDQGFWTHFWSSSETDNTKVLTLHVYYKFVDAKLREFFKEEFSSVRCVKD